MTKVVPKTVSHRPTIERLFELFELNEETGELRWRVSPGKHTHIEPGDVAGCITRDGRTFYRHISIKNVAYKAHMIVWAMMHGEWPDRDIDHEDHNGLNNAPANLRLAVNGQNPANAQLSEKKMTSRFKGVHWSKADRKWRARVMYNAHRIYLGDFTDELLAARTYDAALILAFGEFAFTNAKAFGWQHAPVELRPEVIAKIEAARAGASKLKTVLAEFAVINTERRRGQMQKLNANPQIREARSEWIRNFNTDPEFREARSERARKRNATVARNRLAKAEDERVAA